MEVLPSRAEAVWLVGLEGVVERGFRAPLPVGMALPALVNLVVVSSLLAAGPFPGAVQSRVVAAV